MENSCNLLAIAYFSLLFSPFVHSFHLFVAVLQFNAHSVRIAVCIRSPIVFSCVSFRTAIALNQFFTFIHRAGNTTIFLNGEMFAISQNVFNQIFLISEQEGGRESRSESEEEHKANIKNLHWNVN